MNFIVETKNEYTIQLVGILSPLLYEGFESIYIESRTIMKKGEEKRILQIFQQFIKKIPEWNNNLIETETQRILIQSRCDWLPDLLKAVIKSNIILLSNSNPNIKGNFLINYEYLNIPLQQFIHRCYIECARQIYSCPYLFFHNIKSIDRKRNQRECHDIIKESIKEAIRKMLPVQHILREYLGNEYKPSNDDLDKPISINDSDNLKRLVSKDLKDFINPDVIQNFNVDNKNSSTYNDCSNDDDKETINLLLEIKKKYTDGKLLEAISGNSLENDQRLDVPGQTFGNSSNSYNDVHNMISSSINNGNNISSQKNTSSKNNTSEHSVSMIKDTSEHSHSLNKSYKAESLNNSIDKNNILPQEDNNMFTNNSISYKIEHDSEYEDVFSNINSEKKEKKKRKDAYFSKYNNI
jgi:hypothetical protein